MNKQEMFNTAYIGIIKQGGPSVEGDSCAYRSKNGRKCAAGWLMTDEDYAKVCKGGAADDTAINTTGIGALNGLPDFFRDNILFIGRLQRAHDDCYFETLDSDAAFINNFKVRMAELAARHNLTIPEIPSDDLPQTNS